MTHTHTHTHKRTTTSFPIAFLYVKMMHKDTHQSTPEPWRWRASVLLFSTAWGAETEVKVKVTYDQVWWPILGIRALHLTHPKCTHTAVNTHTPWTHTRSSGQPFMLRRPGSMEDIHAVINMCFRPQNLRLDHMLRMHHIPRQCESLGKQTPTAG